MALGIPLPGAPGAALMQGLDTGSTLMNRLMQQRQGQQQIDLNKMQQERLQQLMPYQIAEYERQSAMAPFEQALREAQTQHALAQASQLQQDQQLMASLLSGQPFAQGMMGDAGMPTPQVSGAEGMQLPQGGQPQQGGVPPQLNLSQMPPMLAEYLKKRIGLDPYAMSPQQKQAQEFEQFRRKEEYKEARPKELIEPRVQAAMQTEIINLEKVMPEFDELINMEPHAWSAGGEGSKDYNAAIFNLASGLLQAKGKQTTNENMQGQKDALRIGFLEGKDAYKKRLQNIKKQMVERLAKLRKNISKGKVETELTYNPETGDFE